MADTTAVAVIMVTTVTAAVVTPHPLLHLLRAAAEIRIRKKFIYEAPCNLQGLFYSCLFAVIFLYIFTSEIWVQLFGNVCVN